MENEEGEENFDQWAIRQPMIYEDSISEYEFLLSFFLQDDNQENDEELF